MPKTVSAFAFETEFVFHLSARPENFFNKPQF